MKVLTEKEAEDFLEKNNFPVVRRITAKSLNEAAKAAVKIRYPIVLKVASKNKNSVILCFS